MLDPYKMIVLNLISISLVCIFLLIYKFVYPKKSLPFPIILILLSIPATISIFRYGSYESGDFNVHVYRNISFYQSLMEGNLKPEWGKDLNATYGYPTFLIEAPIGDYVPAFFHFLGLTFIDSFKFMLALFYVLSGLTFYLWSKSFLSNRAAFASSIFYLYAPYHLIDLHFRVSPGDIIAFCFLPLLLFSTYKLIHNYNFLWLSSTSLFLALLVLSHPIALAGFIFVVVYALFEIYSVKNKILTLKRLGFSYLLGLALSFFYWGPIIFEKKYILTSIQPSSISFEPPLYFFFSPWRWGFLYQGPSGEYAFIVGYVQFIIVAIVCVWLITNRKIKLRNHLKFFLTTFLVTFILLFEFTLPIWQNLPLLHNFSITYRLQFIIVVLSSIIAGIFIENMKSKFIFLLICTLAIGSTILNWGHRRVIPEIDDQFLINNLPLSTAEGEGGPAAMPVWVDPNKIYMNIVPNSNLELLSGTAEISNLLRESSLHTYVINAETKVHLKENTLYYPNWRVYANGKIIPIDYRNKKYPGVITFSLDEGLYFLEVKFEKTYFRNYANTVSLSSLFLLLSLNLIKLNSTFRKNRFNNH